MAKRTKNEDEPAKDNLENQNDADSFGLPDLEYKPLEAEQREEEEAEAFKQEESQSESSANSYTSYPEESQSAPEEYDEPESSKAPLVIGLIIGLVVVAAGFLIYYYVYKPKMEEKAKQEQLAEQLRAKEEAERIAKAREEEERRKRVADSLASVVVKPAIGAIETLTDRTQRYYVVVASAVDGDLVMDYAKKLSVKGVSTKIIPPFGKWKFYRIAISDFDTFATAQSSADGVKADYGDGVWVIKF